MSDTSCQICLKTFSDHDTVPKCLECGHTVCSLCLNKIFHSTKVCPACRKLMTKGSLEEFPTNYALMKVVELCKKNKVQFVDTNCVLARKSEMIEPMKECNTLFVSVTDVLAQIPNQLISDCQAFQSNKTLLRAEANLKMACDYLSQWRVENGKLLLLEKFISPKEFLEEIWSLLDQEKPVVGKSTIGGVKKYTKLRKDRNGSRGIEIPALSLSEVDDKEATIVKFSDLKSCIRADKLCLYLEGEKGCDYFYALEGPLLPFYTTLFTGETGATFKGVKCERGWGNVCYTVPRYLVDGVPSSGPVGFFSNSKVERDEKRDKELFREEGYPLTGDWKGAMEVVWSAGRPSSRPFHVIGKYRGWRGSLYSVGFITDTGILLGL